MSKNTQTILLVLVVIVAVAVGYSLMTKPDNRNPIQRVGDAVEKLPEGGDAAADQLKDRSPMQKAGDAIDNTVKDVTH